MSEVTTKKCDVTGKLGEDVETYDLTMTKRAGKAKAPSDVEVRKVKIDLGPHGLKRLDKFIDMGISALPSAN